MFRNDQPAFQAGFRAEMIKIWKPARQLYFFRNFRGNSYTKAFLSAIMLVRMTSPVWMEGCVSALAGLSAVIFIPDDTPKTGFSRPMMLQNIMGTPLLSWLASSLMAGGVGRFFLVCHERFKREARACFPDDVEFKVAFEERPVYLMNSKNKIYILERFENFGTSEDKDVYRHCDDGTYSIEHIMPQHLTPVWQKELGDDYEQIHEEWLHRMANLTLTAYNSKYSNSSFTEKKTMQNGFDDSGIRMNTWIAKKNKWTLAELEERSEYLMGRALSIWAAPVTEYKPEEKQLDTYTLEDEGELTGRLIAKFTFKNTEQPVTSWVEMFQKVIQILYAEDKAIITKLAMSEEENIALHFNTNPDAFTKSVEIGDGIYVWTNTSTQSRSRVIRR